MYIDKFNIKNGILEISAGNLNRMVDALTGIAESRRGAYGKIYVQNTTGADIDAPFAVLGIDTTVVYSPTTQFKDFANCPMLKGIAPDEVTHASKFVIALEPMANNAVSECVIAGAVPVKINMTSASHKYAKVTDGVMDYLTSANSGTYKILWSDSGTGVKWAILDLGQNLAPIGYKTTAAPSGGNVSAKCIDDTGAVTGDTETFLAFALA